MKDSPGCCLEMKKITINDANRSPSMMFSNDIHKRRDAIELGDIFDFVYGFVITILLMATWQHGSRTADMVDGPVDDGLIFDACDM